MTTIISPRIADLFLWNAELAPGWSIEEHSGGLVCLCSPGTCARELGFPDHSETPIADLLPDSMVWNNGQIQDRN